MRTGSGPARPWLRRRAPWVTGDRRRVVKPGEFDLMVGPDSRDLAVRFRID